MLQMDELRQLKESHEKTALVERDKAQRMSTALFQADADNRCVTRPLHPLPPPFSL